MPGPNRKKRELVYSNKNVNSKTLGQGRGREMREIQRGLKPIDRARQMVTTADRGSQSLKPGRQRNKAWREDAAELSRRCHVKTSTQRLYGHLDVECVARTFNNPAPSTAS